jgi:hypothetical protein
MGEAKTVHDVLEARCNEADGWWWFENCLEELGFDDIPADAPEQIAALKADVTRLSLGYCEAHEPLGDNEQEPCGACEAVHQAERAEKAEAELARVAEERDSIRRRSCGEFDPEVMPECCEHVIEATAALEHKLAETEKQLGHVKVRLSEVMEERVQAQAQLETLRGKAEAAHEANENLVVALEKIGRDPKWTKASDEFGQWVGRDMQMEARIALAEYRKVHPKTATCKEHKE